MKKIGLFSAVAVMSASAWGAGEMTPFGPIGGSQTTQQDIKNAQYDSLANKVEVSKLSQQDKLTILNLLAGSSQIPNKIVDEKFKGINIEELNQNNRRYLWQSVAETFSEDNEILESFLSKIFDQNFEKNKEIFKILKSMVSSDLIDPSQPAAPKNIDFSSMEVTRKKQLYNFLSCHIKFDDHTMTVLKKAIVSYGLEKGYKEVLSPFIMGFASFTDDEIEEILKATANGDNEPKAKANNKILKILEKYREGST